MESIREMTDAEFVLLSNLIKKASKKISFIREELLVSNMNDGDMGSLLLIPKQTIGQKRVFGERISEYSFNDIDGIEVLVSLNLDSDGELFEIDIWKTNFDPLIKLPD